MDDRDGQNELAPVPLLQVVPIVPGSMLSMASMGAAPTIHLPDQPRQLQDPPQRQNPVFFSLAGSSFLHLLMLAILLLVPSMIGGGKTAAPGVIQAVLIVSRAPQTGTPATQPVQPPAEPVVVERKPAPNPLVRKPAPVPKPVPAAPSQPQKQSSEVPPQAGSAGKAGESEARADADAEIESLLRGLRNNWLQPPSSPGDFRCRVKIDYLPGGIISGVEVQDGCGTAMLDDSVQRAIWKTQPLPLVAARNQAGSVIIEFTPR